MAARRSADADSGMLAAATPTSAAAVSPNGRPSRNKDKDQDKDQKKGRERAGSSTSAAGAAVAAAIRRRRHERKRRSGSASSAHGATPSGRGSDSGDCLSPSKQEMFEFSDASGESDSEPRAGPARTRASSSQSTQHEAAGKASDDELQEAAWQRQKGARKQSLQFAYQPVADTDADVTSANPTLYAPLDTSANVEATVLETLDELDDESPPRRPRAASKQPSASARTGGRPPLIKQHSTERQSEYQRRLSSWSTDETAAGGSSPEHSPIRATAGPEVRVQAPTSSGKSMMKMKNPAADAAVGAGIEPMYIASDPAYFLVGPRHQQRAYHGMPRSPRNGPSSAGSIPASPLYPVLSSPDAQTKNLDTLAALDEAEAANGAESGAAGDGISASSSGSGTGAGAGASQRRAVYPASTGSFKFTDPAHMELFGMTVGRGTIDEHTPAPPAPAPQLPATVDRFVRLESGDVQHLRQVDL